MTIFNSAMKLDIDHRAASEVVYWLYEVELLLPKGRRIGDHLMQAMSLAAGGLTAKEAADRIIAFHNSWK